MHKVAHLARQKTETFLRRSAGNGADNVAGSPADHSEPAQASVLPEDAGGAEEDEGEGFRPGM